MIRDSSFLVTEVGLPQTLLSRSDRPRLGHARVHRLPLVLHFRTVAALRYSTRYIEFRVKSSRHFPKMSFPAYFGRTRFPIRISLSARVGRSDFRDFSRGRVSTANFSLSRHSGRPLRVKSLIVSSKNMRTESDATASEFSEIFLLYEDGDLVAVGKPAGLVVHTDGRTSEPTLSDWVLQKLPELKDVGGMHTLDSGRYAPRAGILHRLDRETSGGILIAKNDETFYFLQRQFLDHSIEKIYSAFVEGVFDEKEGVIDLPIGRSRSDFRQWTTGNDTRGTLRKATTAYRVLKEGGGFSFLELKPRTGRTHQLRVHLKAVGHPIVCDKRYGSVCVLGFDRLALHARAICFLAPGGGGLSIEAPFPEDFV